ncbi:vacuolar protein sorting-associated protein 51 homolog isoform X1 [Argiope bruennichi]|uniref:vacuolar protein sorting-associated protein 51 homolog isoform X1 n=1 Tax=Argiope bruennichi TaxID=94029 RepID=UPI002494234B|nr:vacuolar protein sorting-associated protein 51 homolog isoform X1 [Argiope bruennichi]XP_055935424.1 vacuolar protein sorting-associated protein 51 homolog isoform X1 [Argiope bruennichi]
MSGVDDEQRSRRRGLLKKYYGFSEENKEGFDPYNINAPEFNPDLYLHKLLKECNLNQLMQKEHQIYRQIQSLDSEMQTLVYENYNKFISATDTIRKMKNDFKKMEEEMDCLSSNMAIITEFSGNISSTLQGRRQQISKLSGIHALLKKLQFLFELPPGLKMCIENGSYRQAVRYYLKAQKVLHQYEHMPSFHGIQKDCDILVNELKMKLREQFKSKDASPKQLAECVDLLLQLGEPTEVLCDEFLKHAKEKLDDDLKELESHLNYSEESIIDKSEETSKKQMDILEFIDFSYNNFVSNTSLVIASYWDLFLQKPAAEIEHKKTVAMNIPMKKLESFVFKLMEQYFTFIEIRFSKEKMRWNKYWWNSSNDDAILVRALDRFYRRVQAMNRLLPHIDFTLRGIQIVQKAAQDRCNYYLQKLIECFSAALVNMRQNIAAPRSLGQEGTKALTDLLNIFESQISSRINTVQADLQLFIQTDITFAMKVQFKEEFCREYVREGVIIAFLRHINKTCQEFCSYTERNTVPPQLILVLSRFCLNLEQSSISEWVSLVDDSFSISNDNGLTSISDICMETKEVAQKLIDHFVKIQGLNISQMLRKSVETRDWLNAIEPRNVRAVMKRVVEDVTSVDAEVGQLYEEGIRHERSSDSSRRTYPSTGRSHRSKYNAYAPSTIDNSLMSNIQKLFSEKIEIFSTVEFSKVSVMTGIIKISLKTFLECVRLRTFSKYGLQQVQVDIHYLQLYLWHFVADENLVHVLLDEIMSSAVNRCLEPVLMEPSVVDVICERG